MTENEIEHAVAAQQKTIETQDSGVERSALRSLPFYDGFALIISGIRRCGKSTLLLQLMRSLQEPFFYLNFEDPRLIGLQTRDYQVIDRLIEQSGAATLFFDEIQAAPQWEFYVRQKLDEHYKVCVTGSNASLLGPELGSKLTGRHLDRELFPFSWPEFVRYKGCRADRENFLSYLDSGGFPEYLKLNVRDVLVSLRNDILYRDIIARYGIRDDKSVQLLFQWIASNPAQMVSPARLAPVVGLKTGDTVLEYLAHFEATYLAEVLPCFAWSLKAQSLAPKKVYVSDTGLINACSASFTPDSGAILETYVYNTLRSHTRDLYYFNAAKLKDSRTKGECDFIVNPHGKEIACIQVCVRVDHDNEEREVNGLLAAMDFFKQDSGTIVTLDQEDTANIGKDKKIYFVPAWKWQGMTEQK
jgi:predicted AAA+ superfamily ATPase